MSLIRLLLIALLVISLSSCTTRTEKKNFLFDMGPASLAPQKGFIRVGTSNRYDSSIGYGWLHAPVKVFDTANKKLYDPALCNGALGMDSLVFRADVPNGRYEVRVAVGNIDSSLMNMQVWANDELVADSVMAPWYRLAYKTVSSFQTVSNGQLQLTIKGNGTGVGVYSIEIRSAAKWDALKRGMEEDTQLVIQFRNAILGELKQDSSRIDELNQLNIIDRYLLACRYYDAGGWSWASKQTGFSLIYRMYAAADLLEPIIADPANPLYERSLYLLARIYYWLDKEDHNPLHEMVAGKYFRDLQKRYPDNKIIRMYLGEQLANDDTDTARANTDAPAWAVYQREAMSSMRQLIQWWVTQRQAPNGELGGKYGDDVEILRWWLPAILGADDSLAVLGYRRLADGVWNSDALERGFAKKIDDVEHSAELFRDTHPGMFLINYGDPEYVERCLASMRNFRDVWTGITSKGHRHFRSYYLSATEVVPQYPFGVDVALNARALLPGLWAAWYSHNPTLLKLFDEWCKAWIGDAARATNGKPAGVLPSAVAFEGDKIGGDSPKWYEPGLTYDYYDWDHLGHVNELQYHLLGMYSITGDRTFLQTINFYTDLIHDAGNNPLVAKAVPGTLDWVKQQLLSGGADPDPVQHPMGKLLGMAQQLTMSTRYDSLIRQYGYPYARYLLSGDTTTIVNGLKNILQTLRFNRPLLTTEVKFTDRVYIPGSNLLMGMYTGHFGAGYEFPALAVSWKNTGNDVSVFVQHGDTGSIRTLVYNFGNEKTIGLRTWKLLPGKYRCTIATKANGDGLANKIISAKDVELNERVNDLSLSIPSRQTVIITITQLSSLPGRKAKLADLAVNARDITLEQNENGCSLNILVHNIGNTTSGAAHAVALLDNMEAGVVQIPLVPPPDDLVPRTASIRVPLPNFTGNKKFTLLIRSKQPEITTLNNNVEGIISSTDKGVRVSF